MPFASRPGTLMSLGFDAPQASTTAVIFLQQIIRPDIHADIGIRYKLNTLLLPSVPDTAVDDLSYPASCSGFRSRSSPPIRSFRSNTVTSCPRLFSCMRSRQVRTDRCRRPLLFFRYAPSAGCALTSPVGIGIFNDCTLIRLRRHRVSVQVARAGCLAQSRAHTGSKFREAMRLRQSAGKPASQLSVVHQIVALRHQIVQRAAGGHASDHHARLAERYTARHTSCALQAAVFPEKAEYEIH